MPLTSHINTVRGRAKLEAFLDTRGLSRDDFAKMTATSTLTVYRWLLGDAVPSHDAMRKIYRVTGGVVTPNDWVIEELIALERRQAGEPTGAS